MFDVTAKYFSQNFVIRHNLKLSTIVILEYIYSWLLSDNPPESKIIDKKKYFYISQSHIADDFKSLITQPNISQKIKIFKKCGIIKSTYVEEKTNRYFVCFDWDKIIESLAPAEFLKQQKYRFNVDWFSKIFDFIDEQKKIENDEQEEIEDASYNAVKNLFNQETYNKTEENMAGLLDEKELRISKPKYCRQADSIARRILVKYANIFTTKYPKENEEPTKTYIRLCNKITDIYNGHFTNSRFYNFDENVFKNKQFVTEGWKEKIKEVKGDWGKVKVLIFNAIKNYILMFEQDRMPLRKDYLTSNLNDWFFSDNPNNKGQSQFIQSLNEPQIAKQKLGEDKARKIVEKLKDKSSVSYIAGHELNLLLPENASELTAWQNIQEIIEWGKLLWQYEPNSKYFMQCKIQGNLESGPKILPALFARYLKENKISVSLSTLNIKKSIDSNAPWCWFIKDACKKHDMNDKYVFCYTNDDFYDAHESSNKITWDDMDELPVF